MFILFKKYFLYYYLLQLCIHSSIKSLITFDFLYYYSPWRYVLQLYIQDYKMIIYKLGPHNLWP